MAVNVPSFLPEPFANEGQRATIPDTPSSEQGRASWQLGFPQVCAQPLASGGIPPNYLDFQGVLYDLSNSIFYMQTGALWPWSSTLTYPLGAHVLGSDSNEYVAVAVSGPDSGGAADPTTDTGTHWAAMPGAETERWRRASIGRLDYFVRGTLPAGWMACDRSLALFADYPEFEAAYNAGAFDGMVLEATASAEDKQAWAGKFVKNAATPTGLYLPGLGGLFVRGAGTAGKYNAPGLPNISGYTTGLFVAVEFSFGGAVTLTKGTPDRQTADAPVNSWGRMDFSASKSNPIYGVSNTVMPSSVDLAVGMYLGRTA